MSHDLYVPARAPEPRVVRLDARHRWLTEQVGAVDTLDPAQQHRGRAAHRWWYVELATVAALFALLLIGAGL